MSFLFVALAIDAVLNLIQNTYKRIHNSIIRIIILLLYSNINSEMEISWGWGAALVTTYM